MSDFIEDLKRSGNELLEAEARSAEKLRKLRHTKLDLEMLLANSIAEIEFKPRMSDDFQRIVCSSNIRFVNVFKALKKKDKEKKLASQFTGIHTRDPLSVDTYDLIEGKYKTVFLKSWRAVNFVLLTEDNVLVLDRLVRECLER